MQDKNAIVKNLSQPEDLISIRKDLSSTNRIPSRTNYITRQAIRIDSNIVYNGNNKGLVGLQNLGNTCYMNASLQCLRCISTLNVYINKNNYDQQNLTGSYFEFVKNIWRTSATYNPQKIKSNTALVNNQFRNSGQHDAQEFLNTLLDTMHESLKKNGSSIISDTFYGKYETIVQCRSCRGITTMYENFMFLTLPVSENNMENLDGLMKKLSYSEELFGDNQYHCEKCKRLCDAVKTIRVAALPDVLIIHLKRFSKTNKINNFVDMPTQYGNHELVGIVNHSGGLSGGHYTANVKINNKWYVMNDSSCRIMQENIITHQAYILFYEKIKIIE